MSSEQQQQQNVSDGPAPAVAIGPEPSPVSHAESLDSIMEKLRSTPLFMTDLADAGEGNDAVEALKSLAYDEPPEEMATNLKNEGNDCFKCKNFKDAVQYYTRALDYDGHDNRDLKVSLLTNRAAANLELQNYGRAIQDCADALRLKPDNSKALFRSAKACLALRKFEEARECCKWGLEVDPSNRELVRLQAQIKDTVEAEERKVREREEREREKARVRDLLRRAVEIRKGLTFDNTGSKGRAKDAYPWENSSDREVVLDESTGHLLWPAFFLYPEAKESDFVEKFDEATTLGEMLEVVLAEPPAWDNRENPKYTVDSVDTYFLHRPVGGFDEDERLVKVGTNTCLGTVLDHERYVIRDGIPSFVVLPRKGAFAEQFIDRYRKLRQAKESAVRKVAA
ncbi:HSP70/90 co-chaperone [Kickxella alabastrina]|uniref:HSP70/90 co-chaperone n=1 Tax=Kickxella alabastrina TaxID=61397 RepID=A0ACC1IJZ1_9FUNG|nr:HSP70/90 co-chaperone [Kickxella alabastrina]